MNTLEDFFQSEDYLSPNREIEAIDDLILEVAPMFSDFLGRGGWPYEIASGELSKVSSPSASTNAMILFGLAQLLGMLRESVMAPIESRRFAHLHLRSETWRKLQPRLQVSLEKGLRILLKGVCEEPPYFRSRSFGADDPFSYTWTMALIADGQNLSRSSGVTSLMKAVKSNLVNGAQKRVESAFREPWGQILVFRGTDELGGHPLDHIFPLLRCVHLHLLTTKRHSTGSRIARLRLELASSVRQQFLARLHEQLSLSSVTDASFDVAELAFALEGYVLSFDEASSINTPLVDRVFQVLRGEQGRSAYWRPLKPFVTTPRGHALLPLSVEIANSLLRTCIRLRAQRREDYFSSNVDLFRRYAGWIYTRIARGKAPVQQGKKKSEKDFVGWHSEHVYVPEKVHPWETSQALYFLLHYREMLQGHIAAVALKKANLDAKWLGARKAVRWNRSELQRKLIPFEPLRKIALANPGKRPSAFDLYGQVIENYLKPRLTEGVVKEDAHCSMLLYGPAGTGKSTVPEQIAKRLAWPLITITPSDFIAHGESEVEARAKIIFRTLEEQSDKVILLDEIDRLILDRDSEAYQMQADIFQFMTPGMLVKLRGLRRKARCIFVIATNYEEHIDVAAKRKGRIDDKLIVLPSDASQRTEIIVGLLAKAIELRFSNEAESEEVRRSNAQALARKALGPKDWKQISDKTVLMAFNELEQLAAGAISIVRAAENFNPKIAKTVRARLMKDCQGADKAAIRLASYKERFVRSGQHPTTEFLMLLYLRCEVIKSVKLEQDEAAVIKQVFLEIIEKGLSAPKKKLERALSKWIRDSDIRKFIMKSLPAVLS